MWIIGHAHLITWTTDDFYYADANDVVQADSVKLEISHDGGSTWDDIVADTPNTGSYSWVVTGPACINAIIRYSGVNNTEITANTVEFSIVAEALTSIDVTPFIGSCEPDKSITFTAVGKDQNGDLLNSQPSFTWTVSGGGTINVNTGVFTAGSVESGPFEVVATSGIVTGSASVTVQKNTNGNNSRPWIGIGMGI